MGDAITNTRDHCHICGSDIDEGCYIIPRFWEDGDFAIRMTNYAYICDKNCLDKLLTRRRVGPSETKEV